MSTKPSTTNLSLKDLSYYKTGGQARELYRPKTVAELGEIVSHLSEKQRPYFLLGGGTNSLVMDEPWDGAVIVFTEMNHCDVKDSTITAGAGVENTVIAETAARHNLANAAWMNRLPGQLGGTVRMNARCYGGEISQICTEVTCVDRSGKLSVYRDKSVFRGYKDTLFMDNGSIVAEAKLVLVPGEPTAIRAKMDFCADDRANKGQFLFPSCGCVFKNDYKIGVPSGMLLDIAGAKKLTRGGAEISPFHANFVFNKGASSRDILELSFAMREAVYTTFGVWMEYEMEILGSMPADIKAKVLEMRPLAPTPALAAAKSKFSAT